MSILRLFIMVIVVFVSVSHASASSEYHDVTKELQEIKDLDKRIREIEEKTAEMSGHMDKHISHREESTLRFINGLSIAGGITMVGQGTMGNDANNPPGEDVFDGSLSADLEVSVALEEHGEAFMLIEPGAGNGLQGDEIVSFWGVNDDAGDNGSTLEVTEAWYEHVFLDDKLAFTLGKVDLTNYFDGNEAANDETTQFLATGFVNSIAVEFPDNSPGARVTLSPQELLDISLGWQSGDSDWEDIFYNAFLIAEADLKPNFGDLQGNYRLYGWINKTKHTEWKDSSRDAEDGWGAGLSLDQQVTDSLTLFARVGYQDEAVYQFDIAWSAGLALNEILWGRENDSLGFAYGLAGLSDDYEDVLKTNGVTPGKEGHFEVYYSIVINEHISVTPDVQVVTNALGDKDQDTVWIGGIRGQFTF